MIFTVHCQRPGCDGRKVVKKRDQWRRQRFCSLSCAAKVRGPLGGRASGVKRRKMMLDRVYALTPMAAYCKGRQEGWHAGYRAAVKRMAEGRIAA